MPLALKNAISWFVHFWQFWQLGVEAFPQKNASGERATKEMPTGLISAKTPPTRTAKTAKRVA
jgi:hypothetical protein